MDKICTLRNPVLDYPWGSKTFIPQLLGRAVPADRPQAELWMGAHPKAPSAVRCNAQWIPLHSLIQSRPEEILGRPVARKFYNTLPFLFKVLAAARPLSIQAHPDAEQAREGFARENRMKIPLDAPHRNYRDENHKPELICALTPFWTLSGFRKIDDIISLTEKIGAPTLQGLVNSVRGRRENEALKGFFTALMGLDEGDRLRLVTEVAGHCQKHDASDPVLRWVTQLYQEFPGDVGVLSPVFMTLVQLQPGEAVYTAAGRLHAYLEGAGIELMANSDNVLRGGLTRKHVDVPELLKILDFTPGKVVVLRPERREGGVSIYRTPSEEFFLCVISVGEGASYQSPRRRSAEIMICLQGDARVTHMGSGEVLLLNRGTVILVPAAVPQYRIEGEAVVYKAAVPL